MYVPFSVICFTVLFCVLFLCKCVLYYCLWVSAQLQFTNVSYHILHVSEEPTIFIFVEFFYYLGGGRSSYRGVGKFLPDRTALHSRGQTSFSPSPSGLDITFSFLRSRPVYWNTKQRHVTF